MSKSKKKTSKKAASKKAKQGASKKSAAKPKAAKKAKATKPKRVGALAAAAEVLAKCGEPMRCPELVAAMAEQGLWTSPAGKTPQATLYAAITREIAAKGDAARFKKIERGLFAGNA